MPPVINSEIDNCKLRDFDNWEKDNKLCDGVLQKLEHNMM